MKNAVLMTGITLVIFSFAPSSSAEPWKIDANANLTTALNSYSNSWVGGEAGSFTWASQFLGVAERQLNTKLNTKTTLKLQFGQTKVQNKTDKRWSAPEKSSDLIDALELLRFTLGVWVDPFVSVRGVSQFYDGRNPAIIRHFNPWDISEAVGVSRTFAKSALVDWSARLGAAARQLYDRDSVALLNDGGVEFDMDLKTANTANWVALLSTLRVYEALVSSKKDADDRWRYPHVKWENTLTLTFAKYLMLSLSAYAYYDRDIASEVRLKETFSAGITYIYSRK